MKDHAGGRQNARRKPFFTMASAVVLLATLFAGRVLASLRAQSMLSQVPSLNRQAWETAAGREQVGDVNFPTSCSPSIQNALDQGLALLHSFQYVEAEQLFTRSLEEDKSCAMAYWG